MHLNPSDLTPQWRKKLQAEFEQPYISQLRQFLQQQLTHKTILPPTSQWFNALKLTDFDQVKVVILGQDPYPTPGHAQGLSFSVPEHIHPLPKSLQNINKELYADLNIDNSHSGCLIPWARQGVLLLNSILTVEAGKPQSHQNQGWEQFSDAMIKLLNQEHQNLVFVLWGSYAQKKGQFIDEQRHLVIKSPHPSPLSAYRGFFNSRPFSQINLYLKQHHKKEIDWQLPHTQTSLFE